jgi:antitoxin ParD1/3/4/toxin ParE1/3/4
MSKFVLTRRAKVDVQLIWNHIAEDNIDAADKVKDELRLAMRQMAEMPGMVHRRSDVIDTRLRFWLVYSYLIAYLPGTIPLQIVRVVHGSRDIGTLFNG